LKKRGNLTTLIVCVRGDSEISKKNEEPFPLGGAEEREETEVASKNDHY